MFGRSRRLKRYRRKFEDLPTLVDSGGVSPSALAEFWRIIKPADLITIPGPARASLFLRVWHPNLPALTAALRKRNDMIASDRVMQAERAAHKAMHQSEITVQTLDFYLADDDRYPVDAVYYLNRLRALLQEHTYALSQHGDEYYHRQSVDIHHDIYEVTRMLVENA